MLVLERFGDKVDVHDRCIGAGIPVPSVGWYSLTIPSETFTSSESVLETINANAPGWVYRHPRSGCSLLDSSLSLPTPGLIARTCVIQERVTKLSPNPVGAEEIARIFEDSLTVY